MSGYTKGLWEAKTTEATMNDRSEWWIGPHSKPHVVRGVMSAADARLLAASPRLAEALKQCADDLFYSIEAEYPPERRKYPSQLAKYEGDMETVHELRAALREAGIDATG